MNVTRTGCFPSFFAAVRPPKPPPTMTTCGTVGTVPGVFCLCSAIGGVPGCVEFVSVKVFYPFPQGLLIIFLLPGDFSHKHPILRRGRFIAPIADLSALGGCSYYPDYFLKLHYRPLVGVPISRLKHQNSYCASDNFDLYFQV